MYSLFCIFYFLQQPPLYQRFIVLYRKPRDMCASRLGDCLYRWSISSVAKDPISCQCVCSVQPGTEKKLKLQNCLYRCVALSKVIRHVFDSPFLSKDTKASLSEVLCKSIQSFPLNATRQPQVGDFEWLRTRYPLRLGCFAAWIPLYIAHCRKNCKGGRIWILDRIKHHRSKCVFLQ